MSHDRFINRSPELRFLNAQYTSPESSLVILYGRRRVGKTELIHQFLITHPGIYLLASEEGTHANIQTFASQCATYLGDSAFKSPLYDSWDSVISALIHHRRYLEVTKEHKLVLVIDEFPYLIGSDSATPSIFQRIWDQLLKTEPVMLILTGSSISIMESSVLGYKSPLYGRRTGQWQVDPISYQHIRAFLPWSEQDLIQTWAAIGGVPAYLRIFDENMGFWENIRQYMLSKGSYLYSEADLLLGYEFREPINYQILLRTMAGGCTTMGSICNQSGLDRGMVSKYLSTLTSLHMVVDELPVTSHASFRGRHYRITDPYLLFWFRYVYPNRIFLELNQLDEVLSTIQQDYSRYCGMIFEELVRDLVGRGFLPTTGRYERYGRWWHKEEEIDIVCLNDMTGAMLCAEVKWSDLSARDVSSLLSDLKRKSLLVQWRNHDRREEFCIICRTVEEKYELRSNGIQVYDIKDIAGIGE
ncbi:MAG: ATP-binding protein [Methanobacteriota archaeon]